MRLQSLMPSLAGAAVLLNGCTPSNVDQETGGANPHPMVLERIEASVARGASETVVVRLRWGVQQPVGSEPIVPPVALGNEAGWREAQPMWIRSPDGRVAYQATTVVQAGDWEKGCWQAIYVIPGLAGNAPIECLNHRPLEPRL